MKRNTEDYIRFCSFVHRYFAVLFEFSLTFQTASAPTYQDVIKQSLSYARKSEKKYRWYGGFD